MGEEHKIDEMWAIKISVVDPDNNEIGFYKQKMGSEDKTNKKFLWLAKVLNLKYCLVFHSHKTEEKIIDCFLEGIQEKLPRLKNEDGVWILP